MTRETRETLDKMKDALLHSQEIRLSKKELSLVIKYINDLETAVIEGIDEINN